MAKIIPNPIFSDLRQRVKKAGQPPGTLMYTGQKKDQAPIITVSTFDQDDCKVTTVKDLSKCPLEQHANSINWVNVEGLNDVEMIKNLAECYHIHPLTVEDILNVEQRPKVEEFNGYIFLTLKLLHWSHENEQLTVQQISIVFGQDFILSFQESGTPIFNTIRSKLQTTANQRLRQHSSEYLAYRLLDAIVDEYFVVLECLGEQIERIEEKIISEPTQHNSTLIYQLKHQMLLLRKSIWPLREVMSHLLYEDNPLISSFTRIYLRDLYDHTMQAIDTIETFRDMLSSMLDMYLSGLTIRMNEIMKTLTIITTIFIPITALSSIYGMNLPNIPLMKSPWGSSIVAALMVSSVVCMVFYFRRKKWV
ncbi:MAG: magnesium/cobalt transporter CorA [Gammaproteobacteria bacterium]|nr:magnesium/cobalt transporter CorA [Gammaproteobacteria bacterium]